MEGKGRKSDDKAEPNKTKQQMMFSAHNCGNYVISLLAHENV